MAPIEVLDYVIIHEFIHLKVDNHSRKFWQQVESLYPEYKKAQKWLKDKWLFTPPDLTFAFLMFVERHK